MSKFSGKSRRTINVAEKHNAFKEVVYRNCTTVLLSTENYYYKRCDILTTIQLCQILTSSYSYKYETYQTMFINSVTCLRLAKNMGLGKKIPKQSICRIFFVDIILSFSGLGFNN